MPAVLTKTDDALELDLKGCRGSEFSDTLEKIKEIPGRRYDGKRKIWSVPSEPLIAERVMLSIEPEADKEIIQWVREAKQQGEQDLVSPLPDDAKDGLYLPWAKQRADWQPQEVQGEPFVGLKPHQRAIVAEMADGHNAIIADDMGLGKTAEAIAIVWEYRYRSGKKGPVLVVAPNSLKGVWERELRLWLKPEVTVAAINGTTPKKREKEIQEALAAENPWIVVNYEQLRIKKEKIKTKAGGTKTVTSMKQPLFEKTEWFAVIADEAHRAKNRKSLQTKGLFRTDGALKIPATGTPLMNTPDELWSLLHWMYPDEYTSYWRFFENYVEYNEGYWGKQITGVKNPDALRFELRGRLYRRTKDQVLDLPDKTRVTIPVEMSPYQAKLYRETETKFWLEIEKGVEEGSQLEKEIAEGLVAGKKLFQIPNAAARTVRLREVLSSPMLLGGEDESAKLDACVDKIDDNRHKPHVVFAEFVKTCQLLEERLRGKGLGVGVYTGQTHINDRTKLENEFQDGKIDVMVGTIGAMKEGITLTRADAAHFIERAWVPAWNEQAEDRLHRIGQKKNVTIFTYQCQGTLDDERIVPTNRLKEKIVATVLPKDEIGEE